MDCVLSGKFVSGCRRYDCTKDATVTKVCGEHNIFIYKHSKCILVYGSVDDGVTLNQTNKCIE